MSTHGIKRIWFAKLDDSGKLISDPEKGLGTDGIYSPTVASEGVTQADYTDLETAGKVQFANDEPKRLTTSKASPKLAITFLDIDNAEADKMLGYESDGKGGSTLVTPKPHIAILTKATNLDGSFTYEALANAEVIQAGTSHSTDKTDETDANTTFSATGLTPLDPSVFVNTKGEQQPYKHWFSDDSKFTTEADLFKEVFGGYVKADET